MNENKYSTIEIIETGSGWLAVEKPTGISVHNNPGHDLISLLNNYVQNDREISLEISYDDEFRLNPVNRLDSGTSGIIILACQKEIFQKLSHQFESKTVKKKYTAIVYGKFKQSFKNKWNVWDYKLTKKAGGRHNPEGTGSKINSKTMFYIVDESPHYTLLDIKLITGRKHQIRRHAKLSGHPVVCDSRYGSKKSLEYMERKLNFNRLCLHSYYLSFRDPLGGGMVEIEIEKKKKTIISLFKNDKTF